MGFDTNAAARRIGDEIRAMTNRVDRSFREFDFVDRFSLELLFAGEEIGRPVRFFVDVLFLEIRGDDRHVDEVAEARVNGSFVRDLLEFLSEALGVSASRGVAASGVGGAFSFRADEFVFADEDDAVADELERVAIFGFNNAVVIGLEVPTNEAVRGVEARIGFFGVSHDLDGGLFKSDTDEFHAIVGGDKSRGEIRLGRDAPNFDVLKTKRVADACGVDSAFVVAGDIRLRSALEESLHVAQTFFGRIDGASDEASRFTVGGVGAQGDDKVLKLKGRTTALRADDRTVDSAFPSFSGTGDNDVASFGVDEDVLDTS